MRALPAGPPAPNPSELLASERMKTLLGQLSGMSDLVIVDSTPLLTVSDPLPLVEAVSGVVAVIRLNSTTTDAVRRFQGVVGDAGGLLLGVVATGVSTTGSYGYGYGYCYRSDPSPNGDLPDAGSKGKRLLGRTRLGNRKA